MDKMICWVHFEGRVFCNDQSTGGERSENPSAVLFNKVKSKIQTNEDWT